MFNQYPYTDFHELNLDWILSELKQFRTDFYDNLLDTIVSYINQILPNVIYDKNNENITLQVVADLRHTISQELKTSPVVSISNNENDTDYVSIFTIGDLTIHVKDKESREKLTELFKEIENINNSFTEYKTKTDNELLSINNDINLIDNKLLDYVNLNEYLEKNENNFDNAINEALSKLKTHGTLFIPLKDSPYESVNEIVITKPCKILSSYENYDVEESTTFISVNEYSKPLISSTAKTVFSVKSIGVHFENICIKSTNNESGSSIIDFSFKNAESSTNVMRNIILKNCYLIGNNTTNGIKCTDTDIIVSEFNHVWIYNCDVGFNIGSETKNSTSLSFINCWALNCNTSGYRLVNCNYSSFLSCACDNSSYMNHGYFIYKCKNISMIGCGCEKTNYASIIIDSSENILLNVSLIDYNHNSYPSGGGVRCLNSKKIKFLNCHTFDDETNEFKNSIFALNTTFQVDSCNFNRFKINSESVNAITNGDYIYTGEIILSPSNCTILKGGFTRNGNSVIYNGTLNCTGQPSLKVSGINATSIARYGISNKDGVMPVYNGNTIQFDGAFTSGIINFSIVLE